MKISIYGTGYVGLVTGACLAEVGHHVVCNDIDQTKIDNLNRGILPIWEPGLEDIVERNAAEGRLKFTTDLPTAVAHAEVQFIAVGTPPDEDGSADLQYVLAVAEGIARHMDSYRVIINKSTVPVGTADKVQAKVIEGLKARKLETPFDVVSNPEFLKEGAAVGDFLKPDRIIIGTGSEKARELMRELYEPFNRNRERTLFMDVKSAELTKYAANDQLHERTGQHGGNSGCGYRGSTPGHWRGPAHRSSLHLPRLRLWWLLLPQGCSGFGKNRTADRL